MHSHSDSPRHTWWREAKRLHAKRVTAPQLSAPRSISCNKPVKHADDANHQFGFVRVWKPRVVNLQELISTQDYLPSRKEDHSSSSNSSSHNCSPSDDNYLRWRLGIALQPPSELLLRASGPMDWPHSFFIYQQEGIRALLNSPHLLMADEMGLGKTIMCAAALRILLHRQEIERALVVAPATLLDQWQRELHLWAPELRTIIISGLPYERALQWRYPTHVTLVSYETLRSDWNELDKHNPACITWGAVVLDEAQRIKNSDTDSAFICKKLMRSKSWALTGTPLENDMEDTCSILEFVTGSKISGSELRTTLQRYQLRRRKADVLQQLPPKISTDLLLPLTAAQRLTYDTAEKEGRIKLSAEREIRIESILALIARLKQICNFAPNGSSSKMKNLEERIAQIAASGEKALVFTQYTNTTNGAQRIAKCLQKFNPLVYTGTMDVIERTKTIDIFNRDNIHQVLVLSLLAGGQGLNLQRASYVFHYDLWWNPAILQQAEARTHRLGQKRPVHIYRYLMQNTIETRIADILQSKMDLFDRLVEGVSLDPQKLFTRKELLRIIGL